MKIENIDKNFKPKDDKRELRRSKKKAAWPSG